MSKQLRSYVALVLLFVLSFLVLRWAYGYVIGFQNETNDCFFLHGRAFLFEFLDHPAGPLRYAGRFLGQFYHYPWLGALIVSACVTCFGFVFHRVLRKLDRTASISQMLLPCILLLALHASTLWLVSDTLGLCASSGAFLGYLSLRGKLTSRIYALLATPIAYFCLGAYAWFFVAWVLCHEWLDGPLRSDLPFKITYAVFSVAIPLAAWRWVFPVSLRGALLCPVMLNPPFRSGSPSQSFTHFAADCSLAIVLCLVLLAIPFWRRLFSGTRLAAFWRAKRDKRSRVALALALPVLLVLLHWLRYDARLAVVIACRQLYDQQRWDDLLEQAKTNRFGNLRVQFMTNFALYKKGKLLDEMFNYPQPWGTRGLVLNLSSKPGLSPAEDDTGKGMYNSDILYEMGHINLSFRHAYNCLAIQGRTYHNVKRMAQCSMVNGRYHMAAKYLNILDKTTFHRVFARRYKAIIADADAAEREFGDLRSRLPADDGLMYGHPAVPFLILLDGKPDNRTALDYLMAWLLLDKTPNSIQSICCPEGIEHIRSAGYTTIPTHCQEALLLWEKGERTRVDLQGFRYDEAVVERIDSFFQVLSPYADRQEASEHARDQYGDMYVYYHFFVTTPDEARSTGRAPSGFVGTSREE